MILVVPVPIKISAEIKKVLAVTASYDLVKETINKRVIAVNLWSNATDEDWSGGEYEKNLTKEDAYGQNWNWSTLSVSTGRTWQGMFMILNKTIIFYTDSCYIYVYWGETNLYEDISKRKKRPTQHVKSRYDRYRLSSTVFDKFLSLSIMIKTIFTFMYGHYEISLKNLGAKFSEFKYNLITTLIEFAPVMSFDANIFYKYLNMNDDLKDEPEAEREEEEDEDEIEDFLVLHQLNYFMFI
ncbi:hypothetical protein ACJX0J_023126 [Zea mays]